MNEAHDSEGHCNDPEDDERRAEIVEHRKGDRASIVALETEGED
jgi:hypothetical protein